MASTKDIIFGLTIFLTVSTLSLTIVVVMIALALRRLRKKVESEFFNEINEVERICNPCKANKDKNRNKYTQSNLKQSASDPESYESPPLTEAQRVQFDQRRGHDTTSKTAAQKAWHTQQAESIEMHTRIPSTGGSYIECLADDELPCLEEEEQYDEPTIPGNDHLTTNITPKVKPKPAVTQQQMPRGSGTVTHQALHHPNTMPRSSNNNQNPHKNQPMKQKDNYSKQAASLGRPFAYVNVAKPHDHVSRNPRSHLQTFETTKVTQRGFPRDTRQSSGNAITAGQPQEEGYYYPMSSNANNGYEEEEFYENQETIDRLKNTGSPTEGEEIYENEEIIAQNRAAGPSHVIEEEFYENYDENEASHVTSESEHQQMYENYEEEEIYQNESVFSSC